MSNDDSSDDEGETTFFLTGNNKFRSASVSEFSKVPDSLRDVDDATDEYLKEIMNHWFNQEQSERQYTSITSPDITSSMIFTLSDWLSDVANKFKLVKESLCLSQMILKYCLCDAEFSDLQRSKLQLLGTTCLMIGSKVEEIYAPSPNDYIYITDKAYTKKELLEMEQRVLKTIQFHTTFITPLLYIRVFSRVLQNSSKIHVLATYLMLVAMENIGMLEIYLPSEIAAGAEYLALTSLDEPMTNWNTDILVVTIDKAKQVASEILATVEILQNKNYTALKRQYAQSKFLEVSKIQLKL